MMGVDEQSDLQSEERVARLLRRPVRDQQVPPFSQVHERVRHRTSGPLVTIAVLGVVVLALVAGSSLAERRGLVGQPGAAPTAPSTSPRTWQEQLVADVVRVQGQLQYWPLVPTYVPVEVRARVDIRGCGVSVSPCLDYKLAGPTGDTMLAVLQGPAGCCLDGARPNAVRDIEVRPGVRAQYDPVSPQFGGPILWWVENTSRAPVYVALNSPVFTKDELIRIAGTMRPLPAPAVPLSAPTVPPSPGNALTRPSVQPTPLVAPVLVNAVPHAGTIGLKFGGSWWYDGNNRVLASLPPVSVATEHRAPQGSLVAVEHLAPTVTGSTFLIARELAVRDGGVERLIYRAPGVGFYWSGWSPDGKYVALWEIDQYSGSVDMDGRPLVIIDAQSGARTDLGKTLLSGTTAWAAPHTLAYVAGMGRMVWDTKTLRVWSPEHGVADVTPPGVAAFGPSWSTDGRALYFVSGPAGQWDPLAASGGRSVGDRHINVYEVATGSIRSLPHAPGYVEEGVRPSRDGARLLVLRRRTVVANDIRSIPAVDLDVWLTDENGANGTVLVRFPGYGLSAYGYSSGPSEWTWSE